MDAKTKSELLKFIGTGLDQVGDLATWIQSPQRRFHRHEFFGVDIARLVLGEGARSYALRDIGYGGVGLAGGESLDAEGLAPGVVFKGELQILDQSMGFELTMRHAQQLHVGCQFGSMSDAQVSFLKSFIQYMDAALHVRQSEIDAVFPAFRGREWLNLAGHRGSLRFHIRRADHEDGFDATLIFVMNGRHCYCVWQGGRAEVGHLGGETLAEDVRRPLLRQVVSLLVGIRQGASLPDFGPMIERVARMIDGRATD